MCADSGWRGHATLSRAGAPRPVVTTAMATQPVVDRGLKCRELISPRNEFA